MLDAFVFPYNNIPPVFKKLRETKPEIMGFIQPHQDCLQIRDDVPSLTRRQGFITKDHPEIALITIDFAPKHVEFLSMNANEIPWKKMNRQLWFYSDSNIPNLPFSRYFTAYLGIPYNFRISRGFGAPYFGLVPIFHVTSNSAYDIMESHIQEGEHLFTNNKKLVKGKKLLERAFTSLDFLIKMSPRVVL